MMRRLVMLLIRGYQRFVSPLFPPCCRYRPSCSQYTLEAVRKYGSIRGIWLGTLRILRCHPFAKGGYDPVPEPFDPLGRHRSHCSALQRRASEYGLRIAPRCKYHGVLRFRPNSEHRTE